jgi:hypothetical protein
MKIVSAVSSASTGPKGRTNAAGSGPAVKGRTRPIRHATCRPLQALCDRVCCGHCIFNCGAEGASACGSPGPAFRFRLVLARSRAKLAIGRLNLI